MRGQGTQFHPVTLTPSSGGKLATDISSDAIGVEHYRVKRDWRRYNDREIRREGHDYFRPNLDADISPQAGPFDGPITLIHECKVPNARGQKGVVVGTPTTLYRYDSQINVPYVEDVGPQIYFEGDYVSGNYTLDTPTTASYFASEYVLETGAAAGWTPIGTGFSPSGNRWEAQDLGPDTIFNNGVDLPVSYSLLDSKVRPLYELRENGVLSVGTIAQYNSVMLMADVIQAKSTALNAIFDYLPLGIAGQVGAQDSGATTATQEFGSNVVNLVDTNFIPDGTLYGITPGFGGSRRITVFGLTPGKTYHYKPGPNETSLTVTGDNGDVLFAEGDFIAPPRTLENPNGTPVYIDGVPIVNPDPPEIPVTAIVCEVGTFFFDPSMVGKVFRFRNGFRRAIVSVNSLVQVTLAGPPPVWTHVLPPMVPLAGFVPPPMRGYFGVEHHPFFKEGITFNILSDGDVDSIVTAASTTTVFTDDMVGRTLYWLDGRTRTILDVLNPNQVLVESDGTIPDGQVVTDNPLAYGTVTDTRLYDRIRYRVINSVLGDATRYGAIIACSMIRGSNVLFFNFPVKSFHYGQTVTVIGAALDGGNLRANIVLMPQGGAFAVLDTVALTTVLNTQVQASDTVGSIVNAYDLDEDGSRIIRMMDLNGSLILYRDTGYMIGSYTGSSPDAFQFAAMVYTANSLYWKNSLITATYDGYNFHLFAGRNSFYRFDLISRLPVESWTKASFTWKDGTGGDIAGCRRTFFDEAAKGDTFTLNILPDGAVYGINGTARSYLVTGLFPGKTYHFKPGSNEMNLSISNSPNQHPHLLTSEGDFVAPPATGSVVINGVQQPAGTATPITAEILDGPYQRMDFVFSAENEMTKEVFICFPSDSADKALCFDYDQGTISTTGAAYCSGASINRPGTSDQKWFVMGAMSGMLLTYGKADQAQPNWPNGNRIFSRLGQSYPSELYSGLAAFGAVDNEKALNGYVINLSSFSPDTPVDVQIYGATNPNAPADDPQRRGERLLAERVLTVGNNLFPLHYQKYFFADRIIVDGKDNPCEIVARTYRIAVVRSESQTRLAG